MGIPETTQIHDRAFPSHLHLTGGSAGEFDYEVMADLARKQKSRDLTEQTAARDSLSFFQQDAPARERGSREIPECRNG